MTIKTVVYCNNCNPSCQAARDTDGAGVFEGSWSDAEYCGWARFRYGSKGHFCPECAETLRKALAAQKPRKP